jgi:hypothetical protein
MLAEPLEARELLSTVTGEFIVYKLAGGDIYRISAQPGAQPQDLSTALNALSRGTDDANVDISPNGQWLTVNTDRFGIAAGNSGPGLAVVSADLKQGAAVVSGGQFVYPEGVTAIASSGDLVVFSVGGGPHVRDLWSISRASTSSPWGAPVLLTANSPYQYSSEPAISADGSEILFDGGQQPDKTGSVAICEVKPNGTGFHTVVTEANAPASTNFDGRICTPSFAADGTVLFEASSSDSQDRIWKLPTGATTAVLISSAEDEVAPIGLPDGRTVSLWLGRTGNVAGAHELTLRNAQGLYLFTLQPNVDIADIGYGAGGTGTSSQIQTRTTVVAAASTTVFGQKATFTATVAVVGSGTGTPTGSVTFMSGTKTLGTASLVTTNGVTRAVLSTKAMIVGTHAIKAIYGGDARDAPSTSGTLTVTVGKDATTTKIAGSANPAVAGRPVTLTATIIVTAPGAGTPTGMVTFKDGGKTIGTGRLKTAKGITTATITTSSLSIGSHSLTAVFSGDGNDKTSTSGVLKLGVKKASAKP